MILLEYVCRLLFWTAMRLLDAEHAIDEARLRRRAAGDLRDEEAR